MQFSYIFFLETDFNRMKMLWHLLPSFSSETLQVTYHPVEPLGQREVLSFYTQKIKLEAEHLRQQASGVLYIN